MFGELEKRITCPITQTNKAQIESFIKPLNDTTVRSILTILSDVKTTITPPIDMNKVKLVHSEEHERVKCQVLK